LSTFNRPSAVSCPLRFELKPEFIPLGIPRAAEESQRPRNVPVRCPSYSNLGSNTAQAPESFESRTD
ncbi:hypothetical protein FRC08_016059, partial [Ceratobasidium sp. 394]